MITRFTKNLLALIIFLTAICLILIVIMTRGGLWADILFNLKSALADSEHLRKSFLDFGAWAPLIFIVVQILQVILAPLPGEASGFLGGYIFGFWPSAIYSTIGLTVGSWIAFAGGRFLGNIFPQKFRDSTTYQKFNHLVYKGGFVIPFILFIFPGFPKDSLSYILGLSRMPMRIFLFIAAIGRIPGTLALSIQGAELYQGNYLKFAVLLGATLLVSLPFYLFHKQIMHRLEQYQRQLEKPTSERKEIGPHD